MQKNLSAAATLDTSGQGSSGRCHNAMILLAPRVRSVQPDVLDVVEYRRGERNPGDGWGHTGSPVGSRAP